MTDRELLEKAARAAGYEFTLENGIPQIVTMFRGHLTNYEDWNPLENDADASRLMIDAELVVAVAYGEILATRDEITAISGPLGEDRYATARNAIVRAAANKGDAL